MVAIIGMADENIREFAVNFRQSLCCSIAGDNGFTDKVEPSQVVNPVDMVCMGMGEENGIYSGDVVRNCLGAKVRRGVDKDIFAAIFDQKGGSGPLVLWIIRAADPAVAADHRNAG